MALSSLVALGLVMAPAYFDPETGETLIDGDNMEPIDNKTSYAGNDDGDGDYEGDGYYGEDEDAEFGDRGDRLRRRQGRNDARADRRHDRVDRRHDRRDERLDRKLERLSDGDDEPAPSGSQGGWEYKPLNATEAAVSTASQKVTIRVEDAAFRIDNLTLDGTTAGVRVTAIAVGPDTVFQSGGSLGLPASTFTGDKFAALKNLKGKELRAGQSIVVTFTPDASGDDLSVVAFGKAWRPLARC